MVACLGFVSVQTHEPGSVANRMRTLTKAGVTSTYSYDGMQRRVRNFDSTGAASTVIFVYDQAGRHTRRRIGERKADVGYGAGRTSGHDAIRYAAAYTRG